MSEPVTPETVETLSRCLSVGGVVVFPSDTLYGVGCDPGHREAYRRLCSMKRRDPDQPSAVMFFSLDRALDSLPELGPRTHQALTALLPGAVLALLPNPAARFPLACGTDTGTLGIRVPALGENLAALEAMEWPMLQTSANLSGGPDPARLEDVPAAIRDEADLVIDAGELPGVASTIVDLRSYEFEGAWSVLREGALSQDAVAGLLG